MERINQGNPTPRNTLTLCKKKKMIMPSTSLISKLEFTELHEFDEPTHNLNCSLTQSCKLVGYVLIVFKFITNLQAEFYFKFLTLNFASSSSSSLTFTEFMLSSSSFYQICVEFQQFYEVQNSINFFPNRVQFRVRQNRPSSWSWSSRP